MSAWVGCSPKPSVVFPRGIRAAALSTARWTIGGFNQIGSLGLSQLEQEATVADHHAAPPHGLVKLFADLIRVGRADIFRGRRHATNNSEVPIPLQPLR